MSFTKSARVVGEANHQALHKCCLRARGSERTVLIVSPFLAYNSHALNVSLGHRPGVSRTGAGLYVAVEYLLNF